MGNSSQICKVDKSDGCKADVDRSVEINKTLKCDISVAKSDELLSYFYGAKHPKSNTELDVSEPKLDMGGPTRQEEGPTKIPLAGVCLMGDKSITKPIAIVRLRPDIDKPEMQRILDDVVDGRDAGKIDHNGGNMTSNNRIIQPDFEKDEKSLRSNDHISCPQRHLLPDNSSDLEIIDKSKKLIDDNQKIDRSFSKTKITKETANRILKSVPANSIPAKSVKKRCWTKKSPEKEKQAGIKEIFERIKRKRAENDKKIAIAKLNGNKNDKNDQDGLKKINTINNEEKDKKRKRR